MDYEKLSNDRFGEPSAAIQVRVESPRELQGISCNSDMHPAEMRKYCQLDDTSRSLMRSAMSQMQFSARAYHRILKLSRTIADLVGDVQISPQHLAEALQYRPKMNQY